MALSASTQPGAFPTVALYRFWIANPCNIHGKSMWLVEGFTFGVLGLWVRLMPYSDTFRWKKLRSQHQKAPLLEERDQYLIHLRDGGTEQRRVRHIASRLLSA